MLKDAEGISIYDRLCMVYIIIYPLVNIQKAIEHGPVEIVDLPSYKMVDLSIVFFVCLPEGNP